MSRCALCGFLSVFALGVAAPPVCSAEDPWHTELATARAAKGAQVVALYRALVAKHPEAAVAWYELGDALSDAQAWEEALRAYQRAGQLGWNPVKTLTRLGKCLRKLRRYEEAESAFRQAAEKDPDAIPARFGLAEVLFYQSKSAAATLVFEAISKRQDEWGTVAKEYLAQLHFGAGRFDDALALSRVLLAANPKDSALHWLTGRTLFRLRRYEEALPHFHEVEQADPKHAEAARYYVAACMEGQGQRSSAEEAYRGLARGASSWAEAARSGMNRLAGPPFHATLACLSGFDSNVIRNSPDSSPGGHGDAFNEIYVSVEGRVLRQSELNLWLGAEHYGIHYPKLHGDDYVQDSARADLNLPDVGPFSVVSARYQFNYALLGSDGFRREHRVEGCAMYRTSEDRLILGFSYGDNRYLGAYKAVGGPEAGAWVDYRRSMPLWDHEVRMRLNTELRYSHADAERRVVERARVQYRSRIAKDLFGQLGVQYRRADYPDSRLRLADSDALPRRVDNRWTAELQFDWLIHSRIYVNWGGLYESQRSSRESQRYARHQGSVGITVLF